MANLPAGATSVDFNEGNEAELAGHGITAFEVVQLMNNEPIWAVNKSGRAAVWKAIGLTDGGRAITVPMNYDAARNEVRPITGWDSTQGERKKYLKGR